MFICLSIDPLRCTDAYGMRSYGCTHLARRRRAYQERVPLTGQFPASRTTLCVRVRLCVLGMIVCVCVCLFVCLFGWLVGCVVVVSVVSVCLLVYQFVCLFVSLVGWSVVCVCVCCVVCVCVCSFVCVIVC